MSTSRSATQRFLVFALSVFSGVLLLGALLDSVGNAVGLISWRVTLVGTTAIIFGVVVCQAFLRFRGLSWTRAGQQYTVRGLGPAMLGGLLGFVLLLWVPPTLHRIKGSADTPEQLTAGGSNQTPDDQASEGNSPASDTQPDAPRSSAETPTPPNRKGEPQPTAAPTAPIETAVVADTAPIPDCPPELLDRPTGVTITSGDLVILASDLTQIDNTGKSRRVLSSHFLRSVRGAAVEPSGSVLAATAGCGQGLLVRFDPQTGTQTPLVGGFKAPMGILVEVGGETVLVGDENPNGYGQGSWGALVRVNLKTRERAILHVFRGAETATGIALHPRGEVLIVAGALYRMNLKERGSPRRIEVEGLPRPRNIAITPQGEVYVADSERKAVLQVNVDRGTATELLGNQPFGGGWVGIASAGDGKSLYIGTNAGEGVVTNVSLPPATVATKEVWKGRADLGVFVAVAASIGR